ncbi:MAG: hypothetical protein PVI57_20130 [Gemmatimonadota bacterium]|jgi:hypothetical protein
MSIVLWGILALVSGFLALWVVARLARPDTAPLPPGTELPATPLQRIARWSIGVGLVLGVAAAALVVANGPDATFEDDSLRIAFTLILLVLLGVVGGGTAWLKARVTRDDGLLDERDQAIMGRAPAMQAAGMLVTLAIWTVGLVEHFHADGAVPLHYLYLVFWSCLVVFLLGLPVGVLAGYRKR